MFSIRYGIALLIALCGYSVVRAQVLKGKVVDRITGEQLMNAHIQLKNTSWIVVSDNDGNFVMTDFPAGNQVLLVTSVGYATQEVLCANGQDVRVALEANAMVLNNTVMVTAQRSDQLSFNLAQSVTNLSDQELSQKQSRSTPEALMGEAGVWVQKTNHGGGSPIIRGLVGNQVLLMVDGIRMNNATYRYGPNQYLSTVDPGIIENVEAIRGSGSVLYGSDALGGVVNVLTKRAAFSDKLSVHGSLLGKWMSEGMEKSGRGELALTGKKLAIIGGFSVHDFGDVRAGDTLGILIPTGYKENAFDAKALWRTGSNSILTISYQYDRQQEVPRYDQVTQGGYKFFNFDPQQRELAYVRWESFTKNKWLQFVRLTSSFNRTNEVIKAQKNNSAEIKQNQDIVTTAGLLAEIQSNPFTGWTIQSGMEFYHDQVNSTASIVNTVSNAETMVRGSYADGSVSSNMALYSNHQYDRKKYQLMAGVRFNAVTVSVEDPIFGDQQIKPQAWVGQLGALWKVSNSFRVFINSNTGFRAPNVDDMSKFGAVESGIFEVPSSNLSPEKSFTIETGFKVNQKNFSSALSVYRTQLEDLIDRVPSTYEGAGTVEGRTVYQKQNVGEAMLKGIEGELEWRLLNKISLTANATYTYGENITKDEPMRRIPPLFGRVNVRYEHHSGIWLKGEWVTAGVQDRLAAGDKSDVRIAVRLVDGEMPGWNVFNFYTGYTFKFVTMNVAFQNIFDKAYRVYASGIDGYGRSMNVSMQLRF